jgi:hypothetical protein
VDLSLRAGKPFAVVPCCIFPSQNQHRRTPEDRVVTTLEEFVNYLATKDPARVQTGRLDNVPGCNRVVWCRGAASSAEHDGGSPTTGAI